MYAQINVFMANFDVMTIQLIDGSMELRLADNMELHSFTYRIMIQKI